MKNATFSLRSTALRFALLALLAFSFAPTLQAQDKLKPAAVEVKYMGIYDNAPVFQIEFDNTSDEPCTVSIKDDDGNVLYAERVKARKFSKKFKFEKPDHEALRLTVTLSNDKEKQSQVFEINTSTRTVQDVVVTRL